MRCFQILGGGRWEKVSRTTTAGTKTKKNTHTNTQHPPPSPLAVESSAHSLSWTGGMLNAMHDKASDFSKSGKELILGKHVVAARSWGIYVVKELALNVSEVTYVAAVDLGGNVPNLLLDIKIKETLAKVDRLRVKHGRKPKSVDGDVREALSKHFRKKVRSCEERTLRADTVA